MATRAVKHIVVGNDPIGIAVTPLTDVAASVPAPSFSGALATEAIGAIFGNNLSGGVRLADGLPLPTSLGGTVVKVRDSAGAERLAPLFFVSPGQINYQVPAGTTLGKALVTVSHTFGYVSSGELTINRVAPALFTANATGQGVVSATVLRIKADNTLSYEPVAVFDPAQNKFVPQPIDVGPESDQLFLIVFGSGMRFRSARGSAFADIGGLNSEVLYVGPQGDFVGLDQANLRLPRGLAGRGEVTLNLRIDGQTANTVQINVR